MTMLKSFCSLWFMSRTLLRRSGLAAGIFFRSTRAGAVGLASVFITLMCFTGTAFVSDHVLLIHHRNTLQAGTDSASIAATQRMARLDTDLTPAELVEALEPLATRYILANVPEEARELAEDTLELTLRPDRETGVVGVEAHADLGGAIVGRFLWGRLIGKIGASSGAERIVAPVDLVLAIDVTGSMNYSIFHGAEDPVPVEDRRITVVRNAALTLVGSLYDQQGETGHVSVGLVPFNTTVNVGAARQDWVTDLGTGHKLIPPGFGPWRGCIEHRVRQDDLDLSLATPGEAPFTSWFSPSTLEYRPAERAAVAAQVGGAVRGENDWSAGNPHLGYEPSPHRGCPRDEIIPLTVDIEVMERAISNLRAWPRGGTMAHLGVVWGRRLLAPEWRTAWGLPEELEEAGRKKVVVLLTDGLNNAHDDPTTYPGNYWHGHYSNARYGSQYTGYGRAGSGAIEDGYRIGTRLTGVTNDGEERGVLNTILLESCELAKAEGITVFTVSAVPHGHPKEQELRERLVACATSEDHAFVENSEPERMEGAFREIGRMVQGIRRTRTAMAGS